MKVREEISLSTITFNFLDNEILIRNVANVPPHGKVFHKHFKEIIVVDGCFEFRKIFLSQFLFTQKSPINTVSKCDFVWRRLPTISNQRLSHAEFVAQGALTLTAKSRTQIYILFLRHTTFFFLRSMGVAKGHRIVSVRFSGVVKRPATRQEKQRLGNMPK